MQIFTALLTFKMASAAGKDCKVRSCRAAALPQPLLLPSSQTEECRISLALQDAEPEPEILSYVH